MNDGGQAFPCEGEGLGNPNYHNSGMTMRQYYKGMALQGVLSVVGDEVLKLSLFAENIARIADAIIKEDKEWEDKNERE